VNYQNEFERASSVKKVVKQINAEVISDKEYRFMEFCGGHTHCFYKSGLIDILPTQIKLVHGPGCPVCVLPSGRIRSAIEMCEKDKNIILCTYADLMRVPVMGGDTMIKARARGCDIRPVYSPLDALTLAKREKEKSVVFFAIGFETTTPPTAAALKQAKNENIKNFYIYCNHVKTGPALDHILASVSKGKQHLDGIIGPGHVATIIGSDFFKPYSKEHRTPIVVAGFTPVDLAQSLLMMVKQVNSGKAEVENEYNRSVLGTGNQKALSYMEETLSTRKSFEWRGLGLLEDSAWQVSELYADWDAERHFDFPNLPSNDNKACRCPEVLLGEVDPLECKLFGKQCTPESPMGSCMVSSEGACSAYFNSGKHLAEELT
jgi:hydrogenase expression/formation protein HypD